MGAMVTIVCVSVSVLLGWFGLSVCRAIRRVREYERENLRQIQARRDI